MGLESTVQFKQTYFFSDIYNVLLIFPIIVPVYFTLME